MLDSSTAPATAEVETPLIQSHRGGRTEYDDNAAGGFATSYANGIRGFETDVRFTADHRLVIMHDGDLARTTLSTGKGLANPLATVWSASQMLDFFGHEVAARQLIDIIEKLLVERKCLTPDLGGTATATQVGDAVVAEVMK